MKTWKKIKLSIAVFGIVLSGFSLRVNGEIIKNFPQGTIMTSSNSRKVSRVRSLEYTLKTKSESGKDNNTSEQSQNSSSNNPYTSLNLSEDEKRYLANTIHHETTSKGTLDGNPETSGAMNVCCAILNRVLSNKFPNTVYDVITQDNQFTGIGAFVNRTDYAPQEAYDAVNKVLEMGDITDGCLYFLNRSIGYTGWIDAMVANGTAEFAFKDSNGHSFYRPKD